MQIAGVDLMMNFQAQGKAYGAEYVYETVKALKKDGDVFTVTSSKKTYTAKVVILAFGLTPRNLDVPGEQELQGKGVTYCATCDAPLFKNKKTAVVGGTYEALDAAILLTKMNSQVTLIHEKDGYPTYKKLFEQVKENAGITVCLSSKVTKIEGDVRVTGITVTDATGATKTIPVDGVFVENGHKVDSAWVGDLVEFDKTKSIIVTTENETKTPGLFAAGDVTPLRDKQVIISAGEGAKAALSAYRFIQKMAGKPAIGVDWKHTQEQ
jgi:thioredoxin reductase (NADPH)